MRAVTWQGPENVAVEQVPDPRIEAPTDAIVRITSTAICGSDLHLYKVLGMWLEPGDIIGHEPMGVVEEVGSDVSHIAPGDRVVVPFNISCGHCFMCDRQLYAQCETTQVREHGKGAALFGYTKLYGQVPLFLSDILPTAWQAVQFADLEKGGSVTVYGLGPVGQFAARIARHLGAERVIGVDQVPERLAMAERHGIETVDAASVEDSPGAVMELTGGRGTDAVIEAVGMEAHGSPAAAFAQRIVGLLPDTAGQKVTDNAGVDHMSALHESFASVRRGGTVSIVGVYGGQTDPFPMMDLFDKGITMRMGQAHVKRWIGDITPLVAGDDDPLGTEDLTTHHLPLDEAPHGYDIFQKKEDGCIKVVLHP